MPNFLIDINLPVIPLLWVKPEYLHQNGLDPTWTDTQIWNYALQNNLTIITKDVDFSNRIMLNSPPPRVIHVKVGNVRLKDFKQLIHGCWSNVLKMSQTHKLVNVYKDRIEGVN